MPRGVRSEFPGDGLLFLYASQRESALPASLWLNASSCAALLAARTASAKLRAATRLPEASVGAQARRGLSGDAPGEPAAGLEPMSLEAALLVTSQMPPRRGVASCAHASYVSEVDDPAVNELELSMLPTVLGRQEERRRGGADAKPSSLGATSWDMTEGLGRCNGADANPSLESRVEMNGRLNLGDVDVIDPLLPREMRPVGLVDDSVNDRISSRLDVKGTSSSSTDSRLRARWRVLRWLRSG